ncbi:hypothetical protein BGZ60DRAFT_542485 [Tricladium varicosporioides]|nr:hypothetical protein BGZ60DRAFT_542485 [Hymenoscyphus varicosporioides]
MDPAQIIVLLEGPALSSPPGLGHDYANPPNFGHAMLVVQIIFLVIPTLCVFVRVYTKLRINKKCGLEDYLCVLAWQIYIGYILYGCVVFTIKASILIQYIRIFSSVEKYIFYWTCHALIWINFVFYSVGFFLEIFACKPMAKAWDPLIETGSCLDVHKVNIAAAAMNVVSDFVILLLPQPIIWRLNMGFKQRLGISSIFAVALL